MPTNDMNAEFWVNLYEKYLTGRFLKTYQDPTGHGCQVFTYHAAPLLSLYGIICEIWYTSHLLESDCGSLLVCQVTWLPNTYQTCTVRPPQMGLKRKREVSTSNKHPWYTPQASGSGRCLSAAERQSRWTVLWDRWAASRSCQDAMSGRAGQTRCTTSTDTSHH